MKNRSRRLSHSLILLLILGTVAGGALVWYVSTDHRTPPVIEGVSSQVEVFADEDIPAAILEGVRATGDQWTPEELQITAQVLDEAGTVQDTFAPGTYRLVYTCQSAQATTSLLIRPRDQEGPVFTGVEDITVPLNGTPSYREGVQAEDEVEGPVSFQVDATQVDLTREGTYPAVYTAADSKGNASQASITVHVVVEQPHLPDPDSPEDAEHLARMEEEAGKVLDRILTPDMTRKEQARAIFDYVHSSIGYVGYSDKADWLQEAVNGMTRKRGDCFTYFSVSKALLTMAEIPNLDLERAGGKSHHYWQLVDVGEGWYHFDACPHPDSYPIESFLLREDQVRAYTHWCRSRSNYYVYDYEACPVTVEGTPEGEVDYSNIHDFFDSIPARPSRPAQSQPVRQPTQAETPAAPEPQAPSSAVPLSPQPETPTVQPEPESPPSQPETPPAQSQEPPSPEDPASSSQPAPEPAGPSAPAPEPAEPSVPAPEPVEPSAPDPEPAEPSAPDPEPAEPSAPDPEPAEPSAPEPEPAEPSAPEPEPAEPSAPEPEPAPRSVPDPSPQVNGAP